MLKRAQILRRLRLRRRKTRDEPYYFTLREAAQVLNVGERDIANWCQSKALWGARRVGGATAWLIPREEVYRFAEVIEPADRAPQTLEEKMNAHVITLPGGGFTPTRRVTYGRLKQIDPNRAKEIEEHIRKLYTR